MTSDVKVNTEQDGYILTVHLCFRPVYVTYELTDNHRELLENYYKRMEAKTVESKPNKHGHYEVKK